MSARTSSSVKPSGGISFPRIELWTGQLDELDFPFSLQAILCEDTDGNRFLDGGNLFETVTDRYTLERDELVAYRFEGDGYSGDFVRAMELLRKHVADVQEAAAVEGAETSETAGVEAAGTSQTRGTTDVPQGTLLQVEA